MFCQISLDYLYFQSSPSKLANLCCYFSHLCREYLFFKKYIVFYVVVFYHCICFSYTRYKSISKQSSWHSFKSYFYIPTFKKIRNVLNSIYKERYLLAILVYLPQGNISAMVFCLVEIQIACTSISFSANIIIILHKGYITSP